MESLEIKEARLIEILRSYGRVAIGFSGGVDSTMLLRVALNALGRDRVLAVIADTPSIPRSELAEALRLAQEFGALCLTINPDELSDPNYAANPADRCFFCKHHLFAEIARLAKERGYTVVLDGNNADDAGDYRPGRRAARELGVKSPLLEAGMTKADIREVSRRLGLPTADKPAMACLASRIPYGTPISAEVLLQVEQAEAALKAAGFPVCRVRHHGEVARIEVAPEALPRLLDAPQREALVKQIKAAGYRYVTLDLQGYRMGSLNEGLGSSGKAES